MSVFCPSVLHKGGETSSAYLWALVTGSHRLTCLAGTFAGCKRKLVVELKPAMFLAKQTNKSVSIRNSLSFVVGFSEHQKEGRRKALLNQGKTVMSLYSKANWKPVLTDSGFCQE